MTTPHPENGAGDTPVDQPAAAEGRVGTTDAASVTRRPEITRAPATATVIGLAAGGLSALLGIGGGLIMVPAMVYLLRVRQQRAHGTSLAVILPTALAAVYRYHQAGHVEWGLVVPLALGGVVGALLGAVAANALGAASLKRLFSLFVVLTGATMIAVTGSYGRHAGVGETGLMIAAVGVIAGLVSGLLGVGGGIVMVPAIVFLLGRDQHVAQGVSLAVIIPVSVSGAFIHYRKGNVIPSLALWLSVGAVVGATVVGATVQRFSSETLRTLFGIFLVAMGVSMTARSPRRRPA